MAHSWTKDRLTSPQTRALVWSAVALAACLGMNIFHYSLQGAKGLYVWHWTWLYRLLILMAFIPASVALLSFPLERLKSATPAKIFRGLSIALSLIVILLSVAITSFIVVKPRMGIVDPPRIELIEPSVGISRLDSGPVPEFRSAEAPQTEASSAEAPTSGHAEPALLLSLTVSSDPHWGASTANTGARNSILARVAEHKPDAFFMLGDTVEDGYDSTEWNYALSDLEAFVPKVPIRPLLGNHDALFGGQYLYKRAFFPDSFKTDSGSPYYYTVKSTAATLVVVDLPWGTENFNRRQRAWLEKTLREAPKGKPIIVFSHSYFYASGYDDPKTDKPWYDHYQNISALTPMFEEYGVDLVVSGHNHYEEFLERRGVRYAIIGTMGGIPDPEPTYISPASKWIAVGTHGCLDIDVFEGELRLRFLNETGGLLREERFAY